jgi:hypothetical protein
MSIPAAELRGIQNNKDKEAVAEKLRQEFEDPEKMKKLAAYLRK